MVDLRRRSLRDSHLQPIPPPPLQKAAIIPTPTPPRPPMPSRSTSTSPTPSSSLSSSPCLLSALPMARGDPQFHPPPCCHPFRALRHCHLFASFIYLLGFFGIGFVQSLVIPRASRDEILVDDEMTDDFDRIMLKDDSRAAPCTFAPLSDA